MCFCKIKLVDSHIPVSDAAIMISKKDVESDNKSTSPHTLITNSRHIERERTWHWNL